MDKNLSFSDRFGREPKLLVRSPGRANLIGEQTDYNLGYALPVAIDRYIKVAAAPRSDNRVNVYSELAGESAEFDLGGSIGLLGENKHWANYARGAAWWLKEQQFTPTGADILLWGDLGEDEGLGYSPSLSMALLATMINLAGWSVPTMTMARAARTIETEYIGVPDGVVDPIAIGMAQAGSALLVDCRSQTTTPVPLNLAANNLSIVIVNSGVSPDMAGSAADKRRSECEAAVGALRVVTYDLNIKTLRDVSLDLLSSHGSKLYPALYKRAHHVVTENQRVLDTVSALSVSDFESVGELMNKSHESLRTEFEVSSPFLDRLVELAQGTEGVLGAKLTGPGFGGCTVNLVRSDTLGRFNREVVRRYAEETSLNAETYVVRPAGGIEVETLQ